MTVGNDRTGPRTTPVPVSGRVRWHPDPGTEVTVVAQARAWLRRVFPRLLGSRPRRHLYDDTELLLCELVTNAVVHGEGVTSVRLQTVRDLLRVTVCDHLNAVPVAGVPDGTDEHGRGILLVEALAVRWGTDCDETASGKCVWFELSTTAAPHSTPAG